jgi:hypothetical protein
VFDRLFSNGDPKETAQQKAQREQRRKSILDFVGEDAKSLQNQLGASDKQKMDEYLSSIREIEVRLGKHEENAAKPPVGAERPKQISRSVGMQQDRGAGQNYPELVELMLDMMVLAFQTDLTRVCTLPFANEASNQMYPWADANVPHHGTSHHGGNAEKLEMLARINTYHMKLFTRLLGKLDKIQEANGTILDNSMIVYGAGNSDGNKHNHDNLPIVVVGKGGGSIRSGRHIRYPNFTPITNFWLALLERMNTPYSKLGDSTGKLEQLS